MPTSNKLKITDLEFDTIKDNLITFLKSQSQFQDYDFEGSGLSVLVDLLAYNTHYMGFYANMLGNEMFLDSSSLRESAVSHASHLNVIPTSVKASKAYLNFTFTPSGSPTSLTIAKGTKFTTSIDGNSFTFVTNKTTSVLRSVGGTYTTSNLEIIEGKILNKAYSVNGADTTQRFILPNENIDTATIAVTVQKSDNDSSVEIYTDGNAVDVTTIKSTDRVFFLQEIEDAKYEITFGDGAVGKQLSDGNIIFIEYIVTAGSAADKANTFVASGSVGNLNSENYTLTTANASIGGANLQTIESLKYLAPKLYQAQGRACTKEDYKAIVLRDKPDIESIVVYGGEDADPIQYGKVFIAVKPSGNNVFSVATKEAIKTNILKKSNVVTVTPEIVDPIYFYLLIDTTVNYDPVTNLTDEVTLKTNIDASIQNYLQTNLERFDQKFRYSKLVQDIDNTSSAIRNSRSTIKYRQLITPAVMNTPVTYTQNFNNALEKGSLKSTSFVATDGNTYSMVDDSAGAIKLARTTSGVLVSPSVYFTQTNGSTTQGSIDYTTGQIILTSLRPVAITDGTLSIKLTVTPEQNNSDITPKWEQLLTYDVTDTEAITISMVAETII
jgi:hypothetical protein